MLRQRCKLKDDEGKYRWIKAIDRHGEIEFTDNETEGLILLSRHWTELIKRQELMDSDPSLVDMPS